MGFICRTSDNLPAQYSDELSTSSVISTPLQLANTATPTVPALTPTLPAPATTSTPSLSTNTAAQPHAVTPTVQAKKRKAQAEVKNIDAQVVNIDEELKELSKPDDAAEAFGHSIATKLKCFTPYQCALARREIENVIFNIEYGNASIPAPTSDYLATYTDL